MRYTLISPRLAIQKNDFLGSGVPYWPVELAILASFLEERGNLVHVLDLFGENPKKLEDAGTHYWQGKSIREFLAQESLKSSDLIVLYAISYMSHEEIKEILKTLKRRYPNIPVAVLENSQAVTAYALDVVQNSLIEAGADFLILGEPYSNWGEVEKVMLGEGSAVNVISKEDRENRERLTAMLSPYPRPGWEKFPIKNYWDLPYSHGPKTKKYLPVLTSRGCPYPCDFCVVPKTNNKKFRARPALEVVREMRHLKEMFGVEDFQIEDLNPTVKKGRWEEISKLLVQQGVKVRYSFVSGTKAETIRIEEIPTLARGGLRYVSISPETGSPTLLKTIKKPFDFKLGLELVKACKKNGIQTQACFLVGHPGETPNDHRASITYLKDLVKAGLDEAAIFIVAPFAGSELFNKGEMEVTDTDLVSFSPKGRANYEEIENRRKELIRIFMLEKLKRGLGIWTQGVRALLGRPKTKMENLPRRVVFVSWLRLMNTKLRQTKVNS